MNWRILLSILAIAGIAILGWTQLEPQNRASVQARAEFAQPQDPTGFARAIAPWDWQFPRDHGPHHAFQTEWWYYTGSLATDADRRFGFQFTIFRRALSPTSTASNSEFRANDIYMAHFTITDIANQNFYHEQRFSRGGAGLAGATIEPRYRVWLEDWQVIGLNDDATQQRITAASDDFALDLTLEQVKPPALHGDKGLSPKSGDIGNASYYYSLTRLLAQGTITIAAESYDLAGTVWMDHEFSTSALGDDAVGWDWFGLIFDNDSELMIGQIRQTDGSIDTNFGGLLVYPNGRTRYLQASDFSIKVTEHWRSPHTQALYPAGWEVEIQGEDGFRFHVAPLLADQELREAAIIYWEGAVRVSGDVSGYGYAELTGYADSMRNRF